MKYEALFTSGVFTEWMGAKAQMRNAFFDGAKAIREEAAQAFITKSGITDADLKHRMEKEWSWKLPDLSKATK